MARVFWDTNLFVYLLEKSTSTARTKAIRASMIAREDELLTSTLTLGEVLVKPIATGASQVAQTFERILAESVTLIPFDESAARVFASIRAASSIKVPDAIQLACASQAGVDLFVTNDDRLSKLNISGIHFITSLDRAFL
jgi:predicted nucleic acid-binding protein